VAAVRAADVGEAGVQVAAAEELPHDLADDWAPRVIAAAIRGVEGPLEFTLGTPGGIRPPAGLAGRSALLITVDYWRSVFLYPAAARPPQEILCVGIRFIIHR
jgi:hypothetical protein